ncbi:MAG TPA: hypothetical protein DCZ43_12280, partial [candidate division Zixibacteria bacterium]|nr:hypothetical protein [candidate division Zixibacteria bacterium]
MKKNLLWLFIPVMVLMIWAPSMAQVVQMLSNSDFESWETNGRNGPPDDWTLNVSEIQAVREADTVHTGFYSAKVLYDSSGTLQFNHLPVPVVGGTTYSCSLWVHDNYSLPGNARMRVWFFFSPSGSGGPTTYSTDIDGWTQYSYAMDAPSNATSLTVQLRFYGGAVGRWDSIYVDDVTLWGQVPSGNSPPVVGPTVRIPSGTVYADTPVVVKSTILDLDGTVASDSMYLQLNGGTFVPAVHDSINNAHDYWWHIAGQTSGTIVAYYVAATDEDGDRSVTQTFTYTVINPTPSHVPIYSLEHTTNQGTLPNCFISDSLNLTEQITGIVVGRYEGGGATGHKRLFVQDAASPWSGISVYNTPDTAQVGDSVTVSGLVTEYYGETEISPVSTLMKYGTGTIFAPQIITCSTLGLDSC